MKKAYIEPILNVSYFCTENVVTTSSVPVEVTADVGIAKFTAKSILSKAKDERITAVLKVNY